MAHVTGAARILLAASLLAAALAPCLDRWRSRRAVDQRVAGVIARGPRWPVEGCGSEAALFPPARAQHPLLASWQSIGGCGAGASTSAGAGVKWIGRNVSGGAVHVECQANYIETSYGYNYVGTTLVTRDVGERWNVGVSVPYLFKYMDNPYGLGFDVANRGLGDVNALVTRRFGAINDVSVTLALGLPTGTHDAHLVRSTTTVLPQDRQLGLGKITGSVTVDHTIDHPWGPTVLGGLVGWRGGENELHSYRAPSATLYAFTGYLVGPFTPAVGVSASGFTRHDRDRGEEQASALYSLSASVSLEWANDWVAVLAGVSLPYQYDGLRADAGGNPRSPWSFGPWMAAVGLAIAPF